jgi:hypothetical protein
MLARQARRLLLAYPRFGKARLFGSKGGSIDLATRVALMARFKTKKAPPVVKGSWRSSWKGRVKFGLVSFEVEAVNIHSPDEGDIHFHQLHEQCHHRIKYEKVCPTHGPVKQSEIVSGYEYEKGKYVEIERGELDELRSEQEKGLTIDHFIASDQLDSLFFDVLPCAFEHRFT